MKAWDAASYQTPVPLFLTSFDVSSKHRFIPPGPRHSGNSQQGPTLAPGLVHWLAQQRLGMPSVLALLAWHRCRASWAGAGPGQATRRQMYLHIFGDESPTAASTDEISLPLDQCYYHRQGTKFSTQKRLSSSHKQGLISSAHPEAFYLRLIV